MNVYLAAAGLVAAFMLVGHSTVGRKQFFLPMLAVDFDPVSKRIMEFVWHMATASLVLPPIVLLYAGFSGIEEAAMRYVVIYVAVQFAAWGVVHFLMVSTSGLPGALYKLFQWMLFLAVGALGWAGMAVA